MDEITIDAWLKEERQRLETFVAAWKRDAEASPDMFPELLPPGEWDEQYRGYSES
jgi:hypothetical protein